LSQLNRDTEKREGLEGKKPQLSDLRESGAIEQDADMVCFIHRPEYYKIYQDERGNDLHGMAQIIIAKHRNGAIGDVLLRFKAEYTRFMNPEEDNSAPVGHEPRPSRMNRAVHGGGSTPIPPQDIPPMDNPFGGGDPLDVPF
jgi:replicative DNA helicase